MKIIIYGGSFDPVHKGHILAAKSALEKVGADIVYFVPCFSSPDNKKFQADFYHRVEMLRKATSMYPWAHVTRIEKLVEGVSYTYKTIEMVKNLRPDDELFLLMGEDQYEKIESWKNIDQIRSQVKLIIVHRGKQDLVLKDPSDILINEFNINCASHELILDPNPEYLDEQVINYINENGIYWLNRLKDNHLTNYRIGHSKMVANLAYKLGQSNNIDNPKELWVAGIYHDIAKDYSKQEQEEFMKQYMPDKPYPSWKVIHPYMGAYILKTKYHFNNNKILSAIYNHTIVEDDCDFNKIIYCADKLVPRDDDNEQERAILYNILSKCYENIGIGYQELVNFMNKKAK